MTSRRGLRAAVDDAEQTNGDGHSAEQVEASLALRALVRQQHDGSDRRWNREGKIDVEAPAPRQVLGQHTTEDQTESSASTRNRAVNTKRLPALLRISERRRQRGQRGRCKQSAKQALRSASNHEHFEVGCTTAHCGGNREANQASEQEVLAAEDVSKTTAKEQQRTKSERIRRDHPLTIVIRKAKIHLGRRQRNIDDCRVEHDHQLRNAKHGENRPAALMMRIVGVVGHVCS
jgi:hypothetical protein